MGGSIKIKRERKMNILIGVRKKWLNVLIGEREFPRKEMYYLSWDKPKRKTRNVKWDEGSIYLLKI